MKKLIGIILAVCMLSTMASAAVIEDAAATTTGTTVTVTYTALADNAQATMLAYKVADTATADDESTLAYVDQTNTPIVGIDQEASDGSFEFKLADGFTGKVVIKVGGYGVDTPDTVLLLDFFETEEPVQTIEIVVGDVTGDGKLTGDDVSALKVFVTKRTATQKEACNATYNTNCGTTYSNVENTATYVAGDVTGDGKLTGDDVSALKVFVTKRTATQKEACNATYNTNCGATVQVVEPTVAN